MTELIVNQHNVNSIGYKNGKYFLTYCIKKSTKYFSRHELEIRNWRKELDEIDRIVERKLKLEKLLNG